MKSGMFSNVAFFFSRVTRAARYAEAKVFVGKHLAAKTYPTVIALPRHGGECLSGGGGLCTVALVVHRTLVMLNAEVFGDEWCGFSRLVCC